MSRAFLLLALVVQRHCDWFQPHFRLRYECDFCWDYGLWYALHIMWYSALKLFLLCANCQVGNWFGRLNFKTTPFFLQAVIKLKFGNLWKWIIVVVSHWHWWCLVYLLIGFVFFFILRYFREKGEWGMLITLCGSGVAKQYLDQSYFIGNKNQQTLSSGRQWIWTNLMRLNQWTLNFKPCLLIGRGIRFSLQYSPKRW